MTNAIISFASNTYASPPLKLNTPSHIIKKTAAVAISGITLIALANLSEVSTDPIVTCMNNCRHITDNPFALLICQTLLFIF
ncbi:hypothetical protein RHT_00091 [Candidatus Rhabdochlamydia sp. T3358]|jgi:hypothetical protein|nr:hypothetical protein RHT_00091 [Candidatus Rhabdochlamydia sp. T3358]